MISNTEKELFNLMSFVAVTIAAVVAMVLLSLAVALSADQATSVAVVLVCSLVGVVAALTYKMLRV